MSGVMAQIPEHRDPLEILLRMEARGMRNKLRCLACLGRQKEVGGDGWCKKVGQHQEGCGFRYDGYTK